MMVIGIVLNRLTLMFYRWKVGSSVKVLIGIRKFK